MKPLTIKELRARFNKEKPIFIGLQNDRAQWVVTMNSPAIKAEDKMKKIEAFFNKESTQDGIYFFVEKDSLQKNAPETITQVAKGDIKNLPAIQEPAPRQTLQVTPTREVWDFKTALDKSTEIIELRLQNEILMQEVVRLRKQVAEQEAELNEGLEEDENPKSDTKELMEGFKSIMETVTPVIDKHFELRERELTVKEKAVNGGLSGSRALPQSRATQTATERTDGGVPCADPGYEEYFANVVATAPDNLLEYECTYLESVSPVLYAQLAEKYEIDDDDNPGADGSAT